MASNDEEIFRKLDELLKAVHAIDLKVVAVEEQLKEINKHREQWESEACQITTIEKDIIKIKAQMQLRDERLNWIIAGVGLISAGIMKVVDWISPFLLSLFKHGL